jgi:multicomponent Na+:H+ antiporter subunit G
MTVGDLLSLACFAVGTFFFVAGTAGVLRFPDVYTRLHALTKADNLGMGFVVAGLVLQAESLATVLKLVLTWALVMVGSSLSCQLVARSARQSGVEPWRRR